MLKRISKEILSSLPDINRILLYKVHLFWLALLFNPSVHGEVVNKQLSPLVENIQLLHCATDEKLAENALQRLKGNLHPTTGLPDELERKDKYNAITHAGTIDLAISAIIDKAAQFPQLTPLAESVLYSWDYCQIFHNGNYFDVMVEQSKSISVPVSYTSPSRWHGFAQLGLGRADVSRYTPQAMRSTATTAREILLYNWWYLQRRQCLPHPANGRIFHRQQYVARARVNTDDTLAKAEYPLAWKHSCSTTSGQSDNPSNTISIDERQPHANEAGATLSDATKQQSQIEKQEKLETEAISEIPSIQAPNKVPQTRDTSLSEPASYGHKLQSGQKKLHAVNSTVAEPVRDNATASRNNIRANREPTRINKAGPTTSNISKSPTSSVVLTPVESEKNQRDINSRYHWYVDQLKNLDKKNTEQILSRLSPPKTKPDVPGLPDLAAATPALPVPPNTRAAGIPPQPTSDRIYEGLSGSIAVSNQSFEDNRWSLSASVNYKPLVHSYYFARGGFTLIESEEPLTYNWGVGYNNWHTNTWAIEFNNWGPLKPGDGLKIEDAIASISYKFGSTMLKKHNLSASATLSGGKNNKPALTLAGTWAPKPNWFIRNLITHSLEGDSTTWTYGFGYNNWRSQTWALEYNNWGPNTLSAPNFRDNALVTLSWKWNL